LPRLSEAGLAGQSGAGSPHSKGGSGNPGILSLVLDKHNLILKRLKSGGRLSDLDLDRIDGRVVVANLRFPERTIAEVLPIKGFIVTRAASVEVVAKTTWRDIHFDGCDLSDVMINRCRITNCTFRNCKCQGLGFWDTQVEGCSFTDCNLRDAALGGTGFWKRRRNRFCGSTFLKCDLRGSAHSSETYRDCRFIECRLDGVDFLGAVFSNCTFEGKLDAVVFRSIDPTWASPEKNRLEGCDFTKAKLVSCQFLNIDMDLAVLPADEDLIILHHGPHDWMKWGQSIGAHLDEGLQWFVEEMMGNSGTPTVVNRSDLEIAFSADQIKTLETISATG
jgi:uncharacterized protein YjbI with pentapeptide repeats